jgi:hypothetical protein
MSKVKVVADKNGNIIGVSTNNPEYGYIRVEQVATQINDQGWLRNVKRSAIIKGKVEDLLSCNYKEGSEIQGSIVVKESFEPFNPTNPERDFKIAGETGVVCRVDDQPIYRQTFFTKNPNAIDELITHTNSDEIRDVQLAQRSLSSIMKSSKKEDVSL